MSKHTPGPWSTVRGAGDSETPAYVQDRNGMLLAYCDVLSDPNLPESVGEANARLIAAAPEMLEALEMVAAAFEGPLPPGNHPEGSWLDTMPHMDEPAAAVLAAIAKAKGETE